MPKIITACDSPAAAAECGSDQLRDLDADTKVFIRQDEESHVKFTTPGILHGYTYTPFDSPVVTRFRNCRGRRTFQWPFCIGREQRQWL